MTAMNDIWNTVNRLQEQGEACVVVTVVRALSPTSGKPGDKAVVTADGTIHGWIGGGCVQPAIRRSAREILTTGEPRLIRVAPRDSTERGEEGVVDFDMGCASRGTLDLFVEPVAAAPVLRIHGAAPSARQLADLAGRVGLEVQVLAPGTDPAEFSGATRHAAEHVAPGDWSAARWAVVATQGQGDRPALEAALSGPAEAIALIASRRKADSLLATMAERGHAAERLAAVHSPAGLAIGARTPVEIALAVLAQVVQWRREGVAAPPGAASTATNAPASEPTTEAAAGGGGCCGGGAS